MQRFVVPVLTTLLLPLVAGAETGVTIAHLKVVGWDEAKDIPVWRSGSSGESHTDMGGYYSPATPERMRELDDLIYDEAIVAGYGARLPPDQAEFHARYMALRCAAWAKVGHARPDLCAN